MSKSFDIFSSIAWKFVSNKQKQEHNKFATVWREKLKEVHEHSKSL
jgi:hypothetical protein